VSWQVWGIRHDAYANAHRIQPEVAKSSTEKGKFLYPVEQGRAESDGISWDPTARHARPRRLAPRWRPVPRRRRTRSTTESDP
jgi:hypothetical protein